MCEIWNVPILEIPRTFNIYLMIFLIAVWILLKVIWILFKKVIEILDFFLKLLVFCGLCTIIIAYYMKVKDLGKLEYGDFGPAPPELAELSGVQNFNLRLEFKIFKLRLILNNEGTRFYGEKMVPTQKDFRMREWVNDEKLNEFKELREPADAPICKYSKLQPNKPGKIIWFSGPPGAGKSTTAQLMGRKHGYVYYEGDCYNSMTNPFIDLNVDNPSLAQSDQIPLKVCTT